MDKPKLSPDFTMDDLYKIREYNSLRHIHMTPEELKKDISQGASRVANRIEQMKKEKQHVNV